MTNLTDSTADLPQPPFEAYDGAEPYVFVSYSHKDSAAVFEILARLHARGFRIWYDAGISPGARWAARVQEALQQCDFFLVFLSPRAIRSKHVHGEISYALDFDKPFLAVHLEETELIEGLGLRIGNIQAIYRHRVSDDRFQQLLEQGLPRTVCDGERAAPARRPVAAPPSAGQELDPELDYLLELLPEGTHRVWELRLPYYTIGRLQTHIVLPDRKVSRRHLVLARVGPDWVVINVSERGTLLVSGWELKQKTLCDGDVLHVGNTRLVFVAGKRHGRPGRTRMAGRWYLAHLAPPIDSSGELSADDSGLLDVGPVDLPGFEKRPAGDSADESRLDMRRAPSRDTGDVTGADIRLDDED